MVKAKPPTAEEIARKETADALEKRDKESKKVDEKLKNDLAAYKEKHNDIQGIRYKQKDVALPPDACKIMIHEGERKEPEPIPKGAKCEGISKMCSEGQHRCPNCTQIYCRYHVKPNTGGWHGGHTCKGTVACSSSFHFKCDKHENKICQKGCGLSYCNYHFEAGSNFVKPGGHLCSGGCSTSLIFLRNCTGDIKVCPKCKLNYCDYHHRTSSTMFTDLSAGHVCSEVTGGAMLFGDSFGDFFSLAGQVVITIASGGTMPIAAVTLLFRSMKIAVLAMIEKYCLEAMKPFAMRVIDWVSYQTGIGEGEILDKKRAGRSIMFTDEIVSKNSIALFCGITQAAGLAVKAVNAISDHAIPDWLKMAVKTAESIGTAANIELYQNLIINAIKASFMISEILGLIYHLEAAWAGPSLAEVIKAVKGAANVIDDFNILFGFTTQKDVDNKNQAGEKSIELTSAAHRSLEFKHSKAHAERSVAPMSDTDRHVIQYARKNNHGEGNPFIESLMAFDSQFELLKSKKEEVVQAHDDEIRLMTDQLRELLPVPETLGKPDIEADEASQNSEEDGEFWT